MKTQDVRSKTMSVGRDLNGAGAVGLDRDMSRRGFMGGMGAMMAAGAALAASRKTAFADAAEDAEDEAEVEEETTNSNLFLESPTGWTGTPSELLELGISTMPLDDLNAYRKAYVDAQTDYVCEDGTVIPAIYVKVRALVHTYNFGCGTANDNSFDDIMENFTEDQAQAFLDMPLGIEFTAYDMAAEEGRTVSECTEICEHLAEVGYLRAFNTNRGRTYNQVPYAIGIAEYHLNVDIESDNTHVGLEGYDAAWNMAETGTPIMYYVPIDASVTQENSLLPYDDLREKLRNIDVACIMPCYCRYKVLAATYGHENIPSFEDFCTGEYADYFSPVCNQRVETCIYTGNEAQYWIDRGMARQITGEQAAEYVQRSVDDGFLIESTFDKTSECICSCHVDSCLFLAMWLALGDPDTIASYAAYKQVSHYTLEVDPDKCIACGACIDACPVRIISINDEGWAEPSVPCMKCGHCVAVCPQGARILVKRDDSELAPLSDTNLDHANDAAAYRFEMGLIEFPETTEEVEETGEAIA